MTHEPTPYSIRDDVRIYSGNVQVAICVGPFNVGGEFQHEDALGMDKKANADFIVRSCNSHEAMIEALSRAANFLEAVSQTIGSDAAFKEAEAARYAIKLARGEV